jgi:hypothetical protein
MNGGIIPFFQCGFGLSNNLSQLSYKFSITKNFHFNEVCRIFTSVFLGTGAVVGLAAFGVKKSVFG